MFIRQVDLLNQESHPYQGVGLSILYCDRFFFISMDWGTNQVLQQTVHIANKLNLSVIYLTALADVDRLEDLSIWMQQL